MGVYRESFCIFYNVYILQSSNFSINYETIVVLLKTYFYSNFSKYENISKIFKSLFCRFLIFDLKVSYRYKYKYCVISLTNVCAINIKQ